MKRKQRTIVKPVSLQGVGLHTGAKVTVTFKPAAGDHGIVFKRVDIPNSPPIPATIDNLVERARCTALAVGPEAEVLTVEHLLAVFYTLKVDNVLVEIDNNELPGLDGSSFEYAKAIMAAGIQEQQAEKEVLALRRAASSMTLGDASVVVIPHDGGLKVSYTLDYRPKGPLQYFSDTIDEKVFMEKIAPARTFCLEHEVEALRAQGLGKGANYSNTLVIKPDGTVVDNKLRFADEFVRHKVLDLLGDLAICGAELNAHIIATKSGHALNRRVIQDLVRCVREDDLQYRMVNEPVMDVRAVQTMLPHRYPMLLVDKVIEVIPGKRAVGVKNVTINEEFFQGHFPGQPVMPGVLQVEALAQLAASILLTQYPNSNKIAFLLGLDKVKFRRTVVPGDTLVMTAEAVRVKPRYGTVMGTATVGGQVVTEALIKYMLVDAAGMQVSEDTHGDE